MKCPYCGKEMELGYIQSRDGVTWDHKERIVAALPAFSKSAIVLGCEKGGPFSGASVVAYNCSDCKKIIIDYLKK